VIVQFQRVRPVQTDLVVRDRELFDDFSIRIDAADAVDEPLPLRRRKASLRQDDPPRLKNGAGRGG